MHRTHADAHSRRGYTHHNLEEDDKICWIINLERKSLKLELLEYKKYSSFTFIDPLKNIFGFIIAEARDTKKEGKDLQLLVERAKDV